MLATHRLILAMMAGTSLFAASGAANALQIRVTVENLAPSNGTLFTPVWVGIHDGSFDLFNPGEAASAELERLAEDGNPGPLSSSFTGFGQGIVFGPGLGAGTPPVFAPGAKSSIVIDFDPGEDTAYLSFASMILPSNDAFFANADPRRFRIFDDGEFLSVRRVIFGSDIWDAGTEVNTELAADTPLLGQSVPDTGLTEGGVVTAHAGFLPGGNILNAFPGATIDQPNYRAALITVSPVPEPPSWALMLAAFGVGGLARGFRKLRKS